MIAAKDLFRRPSASVEEEIKRLEELNSRIKNESEDSKRSIGFELLEIIKSQEESLSHRVLAAFIISGHAIDLNLVNSKGAADALTNILSSEFFVGRRRMEFFRQKTPIKPLSLANFAFLEGLIAALTAIDRKKGYEILKSASKNITEPEFRAHLIEFGKIR